MSTSEIELRVEESMRLADSFTVMMHRTDSTEWLLAGLRDASGLDVSPSQAARIMVAQYCLRHASRGRQLADGDAEYVAQLLGDFLPEVLHKPNASLLAQQLGADPASLKQDKTMLHELALHAESTGDDGRAADMRTGFSGLATRFASPWPMARHQQTLPPPPPSAPVGHASRDRDLTVPSPSGQGSPAVGCLILVTLTVLLGLGVRAVTSEDDDSQRCAEILAEFEEGRGTFTLGAATEEEVQWATDNDCPGF